MAIHTQQGVHVRILRKLDNGKVVVQDIDFPTWVRDYDIWRLRADEGIKEINAAIEIAPSEHRGSRMPDLIREAASDPLFAHAVFNEFSPDERVLLEKAGGGR